MILCSFLMIHNNKSQSFVYCYFFAILAIFMANESVTNGSGHAKIDFGNCFSDGVVKLFLDGNEIASAGGNEFNVVKEFDYTDGSELKLFETGNGVISFNSFEVLTC